MEEYLRKFQPVKPDPELKDNILRAVGAELSSIAHKRFSLIDKIWASRLFWPSAQHLSMGMVWLATEGALLAFYKSFPPTLYYEAWL